MEEYKILDSHWWTNGTLAHMVLDFNTTACVGIIAVETYTDQWKAYIGVGYGRDKHIDEQNVARYGSSLSPEEAQGFFPNLDIEKYKPY